MKTVFALVFSCFATVLFAGEDGTKSVLVNKEQPLATECQECEQARAVTLSSWRVRRLNKIADRQEARENCGCDCACESKCKTRLVLVESRKPNCCK